MPSSIKDWLREFGETPGLREAVGALEGAGETGAALASGMGGQVLGGLAGLGTFAKSAARNAIKKGYGGDAAEQAARRSQEVTQKFTYEPRTDIGKRGLENVAHGMESVLDPIARYTVDPIGERSPMAGAAIKAIASMAGPTKGRVGAVSSGLPKGIKPRIADELRYNPGDATAQLPGIEPKTGAQALEAAQARLGRTQEAASFTDPQTGAGYRYQPESSRPYVLEPTGTMGEQTHFERGRPEAVETFGAGDARGTLDPVQVERMRATGGHEPLSRMQENLEAVRAAEDARNARLVDQAQADALQREALIEELRGQRGGNDVFENAARERQISQAKRELPIIEGGDTVWRGEEGRSPYYQAEGGVSGRIHESRVEPGTPLAAHIERLQRQDEITVPAIRERNQVQQFLDEMEPDYSRVYPPEWARDLTKSPLEASGQKTPADATWWRQALGIETDPAQMNRETVAAFLDEVKSNPDAFEFGPMPPESSFRRSASRQGVEGLEEMAGIFGERAGRRINVEEIGGGYSDEPYKIKVEKEHGRGEPMRDRWGEYMYRQKEHERGDVPMYDEYGAAKKMPKLYEGRELIDPETLEPVKRKRVAEGGEPLRDYGGDIKSELKKSEGGEPVRDERGRRKYTKEENPDYTGDEEPNIRMGVQGGGHIDIKGDLFSEPTVHATEASRSGGKGKSSGALLYQTLLADASRRGYEIGSSGLTDDNAIRLLSNTLANYARTGINPRDVTNTGSGRAPAARGTAEGPELWRAEAEEAKSRIAGQKADPTRLRYDPASGDFTIGGTPATLADIKANLRELSPNVGDTLVGAKTLQRTAFFDWLRTATEAQAREAARNIGKKYGPMFLTGGKVDRPKLADALREAGAGTARLGLKKQLEDIREETREDRP